MAKIANVALTNTFDTWRIRSNQAFDRLSQFAINNSSLYANTITANVAFTASGTATVTGLMTASGRATVGTNLTVSGNTTLGASGKTISTTGLLAHTGRATISTNLAVTGNSTVSGTQTITGLLTASGRLTVGTNFTVTGNTVLGANIDDSTSAYKTQTLTDGATITWNAASGRIATVTLGGNRTMAAPTNLKAGHYTLTVIQDGTGSRTLTWNGAFKWPAQTAPTLSTAANARDILTFVSDGTLLYGTYVNDVR